MKKDSAEIKQIRDRLVDLIDLRAYILAGMHFMFLHGYVAYDRHER